MQMLAFPLKSAKSLIMLQIHSNEIEMREQETRTLFLYNFILALIPRSFLQGAMS